MGENGPQSHLQAYERDTHVQKERQIEAIDKTQNEIDQLNEKASEEILIVERKYNTLRRPLYETRAKLIKKIENFWFLSIMNHSGIQPIVATFEVPCIKFLANFMVEEQEDLKAGFRLLFYFDENPYFSNAVLNKDIYMSPLGEMLSKSCQIKWRAGCTIPHQIRDHLSHQKKAIGNHPASPKSFFQWFSDNSNPSLDSISEMFKEELWTNPLQYFLVPEIEFETGEDEEEEEEEEVAVEEEEEMDDEDSDEVSGDDETNIDDPDQEDGEKNHESG